MWTTWVLAGDRRSPIGASTAAHLLAHRFGVALGAVHQHHEVVRVADNPPRRRSPWSDGTCVCSGSHRPAGLPRRHHVLIEHGQRDVGEQRGQDAALWRAGEAVSRCSPSSVSTPALRNAFTSASTRLSLTRGRTRSITRSGREVVETRLDVRIQHPPVAPGAEVLNLGDRVVRPPPGPEPVRDRLEIGLEDRLQHQLQRRLDDPVGDVGIPNLRSFPDPPGLGINAFPHRQRPKRAVLSTAARRSPGTPAPRPLLPTSGGRQAVHAGSVRAVVARDPIERHDQRRRVVHEVEQVIEPAARIGHRPSVQAWPASPIPASKPRRSRTGASPFGDASSGIAASIPSRNRCRPSPCAPGSPRLGVLRRLRPVPAGRPTVHPAPPRPAGRGRQGTSRDGSRVHCDSLVEGGARLCPCGIAATTPQPFLVASPAAHASPTQEFPARHRAGTHRSRPDPPDSEPVSH